MGVFVWALVGVVCGLVFMCIMVGVYGSVCVGSFNFRKWLFTHEKRENKFLTKIANHMV